MVSSKGFQMLLVIRLQNSPYFCVFKYVRAVKQKVWNKAEIFSLASHARSRASRTQDSYATLYRFLY